MTIKLTNYRNNGGFRFEPVERHATIESALETLVVYELGFGGRVIDVRPDYLRVETRVFDTVDHTNFEGKSNDMLLLLEAARNMTQVAAVQFVPGSEPHKRLMNTIQKFTHGNPLLLSLGGGIIAGGTRIKSSLLAMIPQLHNNSPMLINKLANLSAKDLVALVAMIRINGWKFEDCVELALSEPVFDDVGKITGLEVVS